MITQRIAEEILWNPLQLSPDKLIVISSYATPLALAWFLDNLVKHTKKKIGIELFLSMTADDGIQQNAHLEFINLITNAKQRYINKRITDLKCSYLYKGPIDSAAYIWIRNNKPIAAFTGSAYFMLSNFLSKDKQYTINDMDFKEAVSLYESCINNSIYCNHSEVEEHIVISKKHWFFDQEDKFFSSSISCLESLTLSLLKSNSTEIGATSSLNWGQRKGRNRNQAYIPIQAKDAAKNFFPQHEYFFAITDDGHSLLLRVEQERNKAVTTPLSNALLGEYFRNRLNLENGAPVTTEDLLKYGRTDVTFYKIDDEQYYMDFSPKSISNQPEQLNIF